LLGKEPPEQLEPIEFSYCLAYLWEWFCELSGNRDRDMAGPKSITYLEIKAWSYLTNIVPERWEVKVLKQLDRIFLNEALKK
jgi:hypothetical protein